MNQPKTSHEKTGKAHASPDSKQVPRTADAYDIVLRDLRSRLAGATGNARAALEQALTTLETVAGPAAPKSATTSSIGDPKPGSAAEVEAELALEKLDP
jgi:hypothetical protein